MHVLLHKVEFDIENLHQKIEYYKLCILDDPLGIVHWFSIF